MLTVQVYVEPSAGDDHNTKLRLEDDLTCRVYEPGEIRHAATIVAGLSVRPTGPIS